MEDVTAKETVAGREGWTPRGCVADVGGGWRLRRSRRRVQKESPSKRVRGGPYMLLLGAD